MCHKIRSLLSSKVLQKGLLFLLVCALVGGLISTLPLFDGAVIGCMLTFFVSRLLLRPLIKRRYAQRIHRINDFLQDQPISKTIVIRLLPVGNNLLTNLLAGVTNVKGRHFLLGSGIGYIPQMAVFALMGKGIVVLSIWKIALSIVLFCFSTALSVRLFKQYKHSKIVASENSAKSSELACD